MKLSLEFKSQAYFFNTSKPLDISIAIEPKKGVKCFYAPEVEFLPYQSNGFIGSVKEGAPVNYFNVQFNPHGNGTHTECLGHITKKQESVNQKLKEYSFVANLISLQPIKNKEGDWVIDIHLLQQKLENLPNTEALIIRTLPNSNQKLNIDYSHTNPTYFTKEAMEYIVAQNIQHLLIDLPSVDREEDEGKLLAHHIFWGINTKKRPNCTITELIYVENWIEDGLYFLNLQIASFELDASPSKPVIYKLEKLKYSK